MKYKSLCIQKNIIEIFKDMHASFSELCHYFVHADAAISFSIIFFPNKARLGVYVQVRKIILLEMS